MIEREILIVGAGISGATLAERYANAGKRVLVLEKRDHIGGNCYDFINEDGLLVPKYGPHLFHTNDEGVWEYVNRFTEWTPYEHRVLSSVDGMLVPVPVNITTVNMLFHADIATEDEMKQWLAANAERFAEAPKNSEESALARVGRALYEKIFKGYTKKQWDLWPHELDASVMDRIPVRTNFDDRYFTDKHQGVPKDGYTKLFERMLSHPKIEVRLNVDYDSVKDALPSREKLFFTGPIDQFFNYQFGDRLQYRSLRFEFETIDAERHQPVAQVNYPNDNAFTRIMEPKHVTGQESPKTTIIREYSTWEGEPYYPVPSAKNRAIYERYQAEALKLESRGIYFVGRLANYKYFNMDQAFRNALDVFEKTNLS